MCKTSLLPRLAIIDLGTNSVRLNIYEKKNNNQFELLLKEKFMVKLGQDVFETNELCPDAIKRTLDALKIFKYLIDKNEVQTVEVFGTCALRSVHNPYDFLDLVKEETDLEIQIISGKREAQLIAKGILLDPELPKHNGMYFVDIGGGSTEISLYQNNKIIKSHSFDLGANRLTQYYLKDTLDIDDIEQRRKNIKKLQKRCIEEISEVIKKYNWPKLDYIVGSSGTVKAYERIVRKHGLATNPYSTKDLKKSLDAMVPLNKDELLSFPGMQDKRLEQIYAGGALLFSITEVLKSKHIYISKLSLREGVLSEHMNKEN